MKITMVRIIPDDHSVFDPVWPIVATGVRGEVHCQLLGGREISFRFDQAEGWTSEEPAEMTHVLPVKVVRVFATGTTADAIYWQRIEAEE